ncbi:hypothetical protein K450DRAFT_248467 [Umbelopsis ramanniana AG]|uniref:RING-type E3 ubiquitin transferase n=1 Tax=Umbelopsis ramanniana AG TaxID=1314678 RepID=A0AAD5HBI2_UMBRA|nr:uncharacterized protein K450DRAFT_248467 [Umbelopsis ramanniana AG]KAI8578175.1 hypothetical protein K450DRAFT_248467 [Umbelopsis ramanniana AG]
MSAARRSYFCHHCEAPIVLNHRGQRPSCPQCNQEFIEELTDVPRRNPSSVALRMQQSRSSSSYSVIPIDANVFFSPLLQAILVNNDSRRRRQASHIPPPNTSGVTNTLPVVMINTTRWVYTSVIADRMPMDSPYEYGHNGMRQDTHNLQPQTNSSVRANTPSSIQRPAPVHSPPLFASVGTENDRIVKVSMTDTELAVMPSCAVCKEDYRMGERALKLPCYHVYHRDCIKPWLKRKKTCPLCRRYVEYKSSSSSTRSTNAVAAQA